jgi:hypothetical protein
MPKRKSSRRGSPNTAQMAPFNLPPDHAAALRAVSARTRISQSALLREALADLLAKYQAEVGT